jgi:uncharacterized membrane protein YfcA
MWTAVLTPQLRCLIELVAGVAAGIANGIAGGGTFIAFPTLLTLGIPALTANTTTTVGVVPSYVGGIRGFRSELRGHRQLILSLVPSCLSGALVGCGLLLWFPPGAFRAVVPWLVLAGTVLFAFAPRISARLAGVHPSGRGHRWALRIGVALCAVYGGYFGAGLGIMLLAVMAVTLPLELRELQGLRNVLAGIIALCSAIVFLIRGHLVGSAVLCIMIGTLLGGSIGTSLLKRMTPTTVRVVIISLGLSTALRLLL